MSHPTDDPELAARVRAWVRTRHLAQFFTLDANGYPVGRSVGLLLNDDWTVDCLAEHSRGRALQAGRNPRVAVLWDDGAQPIPKAVFLRGDASLQTGDDLVAAYNRRIENFRRRGQPRQPRPEAAVRSEMVNIRIVPHVIRIEGFGQGTQATEWRLS